MASSAPPPAAVRSRRCGIATPRATTAWLRNAPRAARRAARQGDLRIPRFSALGIGEAHHEHIAALSVANGSNGSNPGRMGVADYLAVLRAAG